MNGFHALKRSHCEIRSLLQLLKSTPPLLDFNCTDFHSLVGWKDAFVFKLIPLSVTRGWVNPMAERAAELIDAAWGNGGLFILPHSTRLVCCQSATPCPLKKKEGKKERSRRKARREKQTGERQGVGRKKETSSGGQKEAEERRGTGLLSSPLRLRLLSQRRHGDHLTHLALPYEGQDGLGFYGKGRVGDSFAVLSPLRRR